MSEEQKSTDLVPQDIRDMNRSLTCLDGSALYPVAEVRRFYVFSLYSSKKIAEKFNISLTELDKIRLEENWDKLRLDNKEKIMELINERIADVMYTEFDNQMKLQHLSNLQHEQKIRWLEGYLQKWGDLFARNPETGDTLVDIYGQPISLKLPASSKDIKAKMQAVAFVEGLKRILSEALSLSPGEVKTKIQFIDITSVDLNQYNLFGPPKP